MGKYFITEFLNIDCDDLGNLYIEFKIDGDQFGAHRQIESEEYYNWVIDTYGNEEEEYEDLTQDWEDDYETIKSFTFTEWLIDHHGEDSVMDFIYKHFPTLEDLPHPNT